MIPEARPAAGDSRLYEMAADQVAAAKNRALPRPTPNIISYRCPNRWAVRRRERPELRDRLTLGIRVVNAAERRQALDALHLRGTLWPSDVPDLMARWHPRGDVRAVWEGELVLRTGGGFDPPPNYAGEAAASGAYGEKVTHPDQVGPAIRRALDALDRQGVPAVLDMWLPKLITGEL